MSASALSRDEDETMTQDPNELLEKAQTALEDLSALIDTPEEEV
jgi:hypothetical protein